MTDDLKERGQIYLRDVYKSYGKKLVLDNIDLAVSTGELCTVVGPSGCGKSTLLRLILGQEAVSSGIALFEGESIGRANPKRGIVYQKYSLFPHLSVLDNVLLGKHLPMSPMERWRNRKTLRNEAMRYLERTRLAAHAEKYPHELSGGMQQRVAIAQALIMKPKVLLMDEPFGALDPGMREDMQVFLLELWEETGMTIFFVTHDLEEAAYLGTRLLVVSQFYTDDRGQEANVVRGAKIVGDHKLPREALATHVKATPEFAGFVAKVRQEGFDPSFRRHAREFNLAHPDSFRTLSPEEDSHALKR